ncbi:hypothetical protein H8E77_12260, partial [bacterium]|nr:hypothetical protein [bacterium]
AEVVERFGTEPQARRRQAELLRQVVESAKVYPTIKRVLIWGSFVTDKLEPADLDFSVVVSITHWQTKINDEHRRFFVPHEARLRYGVDRSFLILPDYPLEPYIESLDFICHTRTRRERGIVEINIRGEAIN